MTSPKTQGSAHGDDEKPDRRQHSSYGLVPEQLEAEGTETKINANVLGYFALERSGLDNDEKMHVIGLASNSLEFKHVSDQLRDLYRDSSRKRKALQRPPQDAFVFHVCPIRILKRMLSNTTITRDHEKSVFPGCRSSCYLPSLPQDPDYPPIQVAVANGSSVQ